MPSWLRLWHDMPTDPKWRTIARVSQQPISLVMAIYLHLLVDASRAVTRGHVAVTAEDLASALDVSDDSVFAVLAAMQGRVLDGDLITGWSKRQPSREDAVGFENGSKPAAARKRAQRERDREAIAEDAEAMLSRTVTHCHAPDTDTDTDTDTEKPKHLRKTAAQVVQQDSAFAEFWTAYPKKRNKGDAAKAWMKIPNDTHGKIMAGLAKSIASVDWTKEGGKYVPYPASWLNSMGWEDAIDEPHYSEESVAVMQVYNNTLTPKGWPAASDAPFSQDRSAAIREFLTFSEKPGFVSKYFAIVAETMKSKPGCGFDWLIRRETFLKVKEDVYGVAA